MITILYTYFDIRYFCFAAVLRNSLKVKLFHLQLLVKIFNILNPVTGGLAIIYLSKRPKTRNLRKSHSSYFFQLSTKNKPKVQSAEGWTSCNSSICRTGLLLTDCIFFIKLKKNLLSYICENRICSLYKIFNLLSGRFYH